MVLPMSTNASTPTRYDMAKRLSTAAEWAESSLDGARATLVKHTAEVATGERRAMDLVRWLHGVVEAEATAALYTEAVQVYEHAGIPELRRWLVETSLASPDDTWSGRTNDERRVAWQGSWGKELLTAQRRRDRNRWW